MLVSLRSMPLAAATLATVAGTLGGTAQAAVLALSTAGDDTFVCRAIVSRNDGFLATAAPLKQRIAGKERKYFELGPLEVGDDDVSPNFRRLTLQCWMHDPLDFSTDVPNGARSYSIALNHDDALWVAFDAAHQTTSIQLPRDGTVVHFKLARTGSALHAIRIVSASLIEEHNDRLHYELGGAPYLLF